MSYEVKWTLPVRRPPLGEMLNAGPRFTLHSLCLLYELCVLGIWQVCKHADGTVFVGSGGGGGSSSSSVSSSGSTGSSSGGGGGGSAPPSTVSKVPKPPLAICSDPANGEVICLFNAVIYRPYLS
jgi:hypothetical protein